jgi:tetratricopeptide (TPR) repeat protein
VAALSVMVLVLSAVVALAIYHRSSVSDAVDQLSSDEIRSLEQRVVVLQQNPAQIKTRDKWEGKIGQVKRLYELATIKAVLAWTKGDSLSALTNLDEAIQTAQECYQYNHDAFFELGGKVTLDQVSLAREELAMAELAQVRLKRSLAGEPTNWFRIAILANRRTRPDRLNCLTAPSNGGSPLPADELKILNSWVNTLMRSWRIIHANVEEGRGYSKTQLSEAGYQVCAARAQLAFFMRDFAKALDEQQKAVAFSSDWSARINHQLAFSPGDPHDHFHLVSWLRLADQSREEAAVQLIRLEEAAKRSSDMSVKSIASDKGSDGRWPDLPSEPGIEPALIDSVHD